jgi:threonyl-tRNA synthetase
VQVAVLPVSDKFNSYGQQVAEELRSAGIRAELDDSPEKIGAKIRRSALAKIPYMAVLGAKEVQSGGVAVRSRTDGDLGAMDIAEFLSALRGEIESKGREPLAVKNKA